MAKFSARGNHKVAYATKTEQAESGSIVKVAIGLRSDGKVLRRIDVKLEGSDRWSRGGYSIINPKSKATIEAFKSYAARRGFTIENV